LKITRYDGKDIKRVLIGMVTDDVVCARIASKWTPEGLFASRKENLIGRWCVRHVRKYGRAPGREIESLFDDWASGKEGQEETIKFVEGILHHLSSEYEKNGDGYASDYLIDLAGKVFNRVATKRAMEAAEIDLERNKVDDAQRKLIDLGRVELGVGGVIKPGEDYQSWRDALDNEAVKPLIQYPGILGRFVGNEFARDSFVAFMGSSKRGKSWILLDLAYRAVKQRCRVVYFEAGDLSQRQLMRRMGQRALRRPKRSGSYKLPIDYPSSKGDPIVKSKDLEGITPQDCFKVWKKVQRGKDKFRLSCHPNSSLTTETISSLLFDWEREGWVVDVVVVDYADILAPPNGVKESRDRINEIWKHLRRISQEFHCLVVTATQADAASYDRQLLNRRNFSEDRRKHDHVTAMLGINVTDEDKKNGVARFNWLDRRDDAFIESNQVYVAGCLDIGCPIMKSTF